MTRVLTDLAKGHSSHGSYTPLIVFRRKRGQPVADRFRDDLAACQVAYREVAPRPKLRTLSELRAIIREFRPDVFVAHGYSEHIWGRMAALAEGVPVVVHAEHAHERYKWLHLRRARKLAERTSAIVGVSRGVVDRLRALGFPSSKLHVVYNGVRVDRFEASSLDDWNRREPAVIMAARFGQPKDQQTLIRAIALLREQGTDVRCRLAGGGKRFAIWRAQVLARRLGVRDLVEFLGPRTDVPELLRRHKVAVLSTQREGFGLAVVESMAAGCAVVGTRAPGVEELLAHRRTGWLAAVGDPMSMAEGILRALRFQGHLWAGAAVVDVRGRFGIERMAADYEALFDSLRGVNGAPRAERREAVLV